MSENDKTAETLLDQLIERRMLELEGGTDRAQLAAGISKVLASGQDPGQRATELAEWLLGQDGVAELFASDDDLASVLSAS